MKCWAFKVGLWKIWGLECRRTWCVQLQMWRRWGTCWCWRSKLFCSHCHEGISHLCWKLKWQSSCFKSCNFLKFTSLPKSSRSCSSDQAKAISCSISKRIGEVYYNTSSFLSIWWFAAFSHPPEIVIFSKILAGKFTKTHHMNSKMRKWHVLVIHVGAELWVVWKVDSHEIIPLFQKGLGWTSAVEVVPVLPADVLVCWAAWCS